MEKWRPVVGYEGWYEVSDQGRVRNVKTRGGSPAGHILTGCPSKKGYLSVCLTVNTKQKVKHVHRLVGEAFLGPLQRGLQTDHINGDKTDNRAANLRYVTGFVNQRKSYEPQFYRHVPRGEAHSQSKLKETQVRAIKRLLRLGMIHRLIADRFRISVSTIDAINSGRLWTHITEGG